MTHEEKAFMNGISLLQKADTEFLLFLRRLFSGYRVGLANMQSEALFDTDVEALEALIQEQDSIVGIFDDAIGRRKPDNVAYIN